jgi:predicted short-subunit dehydrogenase-like oxidoreductase (DUF2520 family)
MSRLQRQKVVIIGCGNVAWHLAKKLQATNRYYLEVYNHRQNPALGDFKKKLDCKTIVGLHNISDDAEYYIVCVADTYIPDAARHIKPKKPGALLVHTSGSADIKELGRRAHSTGVIYPLQTFTRGLDVNWRDVPVLCESDEEAIARVKEFAGNFSKNLIRISHTERTRIHAAAVFVSNFSNSMYVAASDILRGSGKNETSFDLSLLGPLIRYTTEKSLSVGPVAAQTGPAKRNDKVVMKKHLAVLSGDGDLRKVYKVLSKLIARQQKKGYAELQGKAQ